MVTTTPVYESPVTVSNMQGTQAHCRAAKDLFDAAPITGLEVELTLDGDHVVDSPVRLVYFPRPVLTLKEGQTALYRETPGQEVGLLSSHPIGDLELPRLRC